MPEKEVSAPVKRCGKQQGQREDHSWFECKKKPQNLNVPSGNSAEFMTLPCVCLERLSILHSGLSCGINALGLGDWFLFNLISLEHKVAPNKMSNRNDWKHFLVSIAYDWRDDPN